jgi:pimeloyl-ACP methyl ester carboxylesterase
VTDDIIVLLPGITGSVLQKDGEDVFGLTASAGLRALFTGGRSITGLKVDPRAAAGERPDDGVTAARVAHDAHLIPGLWKIDGYSALGDHLVRRLQAVPGESYFEFPYDWRLDNRIAAADLRDAIARWLAARRQSRPDAKVVLVAHSMGGLVSRYYLEVLGGWRDARALVTFGTPHRGSLNALDFLANGIRKAFGLIDLSELVRSFPSVYQLLPIFRCIDIGDEQPAHLTDVAHRIPGLDPEAVRAARAFHREIEDAVAANRQLGEYLERGYRQQSVIGIEHPTKQSAVLSAEGLTIVESHLGIDHGGDGTVPRVAASPMEAGDDATAMFAGTRHASLQNADAVLVQVRGWLSGVDLGAFRAGAPVRLAVGLEDVHAAGEPLRISVTPTESVAEIRYRLEPVAAGPGAEGAVPGFAPVTGAVPAVDGMNELEIVAPGPGLFRVVLSGGAEVEPVSDLVVVAQP